MIRRAVAIAFVLAVGAVFAAPASATKGDTVKFQETYAIPDDLADVEDLGELNHGCFGGLYTLVDGTFKKKVTTTFFPTEEAWNQEEPGATMTVIGKNSYNGLWDVDVDSAARFELQDNNINYEFRFGIANPDEPESGSFSWKGSFVERSTGEVAEWWNFNVTFDATGETGTTDGTCS